jgi:hypothetical protein
LGKINREGISQLATQERVPCLNIEIFLFEMLGYLYIYINVYIYVYIPVEEYPWHIPIVFIGFIMKFPVSSASSSILRFYPMTFHYSLNQNPHSTSTASAKSIIIHRRFSQLETSISILFPCSMIFYDFIISRWSIYICICRWSIDYR